jgi:lipoate synthase
MNKRKPEWLRAKLPTSNEYKVVREIVDTHGPAHCLQKCAVSQHG